MGIHLGQRSLDGSAGDRRSYSLPWGEQTAPANAAQATVNLHPRDSEKFGETRGSV